MLFIIYLLHYQRVAVGGGECTCELVFVSFKTFLAASIDKHRHAHTEKTQQKKIARNVWKLETAKKCSRNFDSWMRLTLISRPWLMNRATTTTITKRRRRRSKGGGGKGRPQNKKSSASWRRPQRASERLSGSKAGREGGRERERARLREINDATIKGRN